MDRLDFYAWMGNVIRFARLSKGLAQVELAEAVGLRASRQSISLIESGGMPVPLRRAAQFEKALDLPEGFLLQALVTYRTRGGGPIPFPYLEEWRPKFGRDLRHKDLFASLVTFSRTGTSPPPTEDAHALAASVSGQTLVKWVPYVRRRPVPT